jgi:hypothetical protein
MRLLTPQIIKMMSKGPVTGKPPCRAAYTMWQDVRDGRRKAEPVNVPVDFGIAIDHFRAEER